MSLPTKMNAPPRRPFWKRLLRVNPVLALAAGLLALGAGCDEGSSNGAPSASGGATGSGGSTSGTSGGGAGATSTTSLTITVSGEAPRAVAPTFFGQNYWSWINAWGDSVAKVRDQTAEIGLGLLRAGGANNDTQDPEPFTFAEVDDYVAFAHAVGAEPLLQAPVLHDPQGEVASADDAAELVTYVNQTKTYGVHNFSIGNEPDLYVDQGHASAGFDAKAVCTTFSAFAPAMKAADPSISIWGPDLSWKYQPGNDWLTPFLQQCGDTVDVVAVHRYPLAPEACTEAAAYSDATKFRQLIKALRAQLSAAGQGDKPLAITEANITYDGDPAKTTLPASPGTFPATLWLADNLGVGLEDQLYNISYWSLSEGWTLGFFDGTTPRPALHVLQLFARHFGSEVLSVSGSTASVSVYAGRDAEQTKTALFVVNKTTSNVKVETTLTNLPRSDAPVVTVPPLSLTLVELKDDGSAAETLRYTANMSAPAAP
jgi:hypothetical protein